MRYQELEDDNETPMVNRQAINAKRMLADTKYDFLRPRYVRRALIIMLAFSLLAWFWGDYQHWTLLSNGATVAAIITLFALIKSTRSLLEIPKSVSDERVEQLKGHVFRQAYFAAVAVVAGACFAIVILDASKQLIQSAAIPIAILIPSLPITVYAWRAQTV